MPKLLRLSNALLEKETVYRKEFLEIFYADDEKNKEIVKKQEDQQEESILQDSALDKDTFQEKNSPLEDK